MTINPKFHRTALWMAFWLAVLLLIAFNALLAWVAIEPRNLRRALPYIEAALAPEGSDYTVKIRQGMLLWNGWRHPLDIRLHALEVHEKDGTLLAFFPDVSLGLDVFALPLGRIQPTALVLHRPVMRVVKTETAGFRFAFQPPEQAAPAEESAAAGNAAVTAEVLRKTLYGEDASLRHLRRVEVLNAEVQVVNEQGQLLLAADHVQIKLSRAKGSIAVAAEASIPQQEMQGEVRIDGVLLAKGEPEFGGNLHLTHLYPAAFVPLMAELQPLLALDFPISGWASFTQSRSGAFTAAYTLEGDKGVIRHALLEKPIALSHVQAEGSASGLDDVTVKHLLVETEGVRAEADAHLRLTEEGLSAEGSAMAGGVPVSRIGEFWPPSLSRLSRAWVTENITAGVASHVQARFNIAPGDLALPALPEKDLDAAITFTGGEVHYLPQHAPVRQAAGTVHINGKSLTAEITSAQTMADTHLSNGHLLIEDLNLDNPRIALQLDAAAPATDMVEFMSQPPLACAGRLKLDKERITGAVQGHADVGFYYFAPRDAKGRPREDLGLDYKVEATVAQLSQPGLLGRFDVSSANGTVHADNQSIHFAGGGQVNGATVNNAEIGYRYQPQAGYDTSINVSARAPVSALPRFGLPRLPGLEGVLGVTLQYREGPSKREVKASADAKAAGISIADLGWEKPAGIPAFLEVEAHGDADTLSLDHFAFASRDDAASGSAQLTMKGELKHLALSPLRLGANDVTAEYEPIPGGYRIAAHGKTANLTAWHKSGGGDFAFSRIPALEMDIDVDRVIIGEDRELRALKGIVDCGTDTCRKVELAGQAGGAPFSVHIGMTPKGRALQAQAENAGEFLKAADIYDNMHGGGLNLEGQFDDAAVPRKLTGTLTISEHVIEHAPFLARMLSLASLGGLLDTLRGKGMTFTKLSAPFTLQQDVITLKDAKTHGPAMGLSADGTIRFPGEVLDLRGTIVPSYTLNHILSNVPLLGDLATGGGDGVFGARYHISGKAADPNLSVNPLSMLTPGFLRGVFGVFDRKTPEPSAEAPAKDTPEPAPQNP